MKSKRINIKHAETIEEAVNVLEGFFEADMWYACKNEWKTEKDMWKYLKEHFDILRKEIKLIKRRKDIKKEVKE